MSRVKKVRSGCIDVPKRMVTAKAVLVCPDAGVTVAFLTAT